MSNPWATSRLQYLQAGGAAATLLAGVYGFYSKFPSWVSAGLVGAALGYIAHWLIAAIFFRTIQSSPIKLTLVDTEFVPDDREKITFKRKLYVQLVNEGETSVVLGPGTTWSHRDLHVLKATELVWSVEGPNGWRNKSWGPEAGAVVLPPGKHCRTWVALPLDAKEDEVAIYTKQKRAGEITTNVSSAHSQQISV
jgi:hypothetical protein